MGQMVLVVDDDMGMQLTFAGILEDAGYEVAVAGDGIEALTKLTDVRPAVVVLDLAMPRMDGFAFAAELERRGLREGLPIVVLTVNGRAPEQAARIGADGYLTKPFALARLLAEVRRIARPQT